MAKKYKNIPVEEEIYFQEKAIAEANGFGERGVGAQVGTWVKRELPDCEHEKMPVMIELFSGADALGTLPQRTGWYCPTCKRVYQRVEKGGGQGSAISGQGAGAEDDPYGQPIVSGQGAGVSTEKKRPVRQRIGRDF